ncbi:MAG: acylneuraminate cytidylyltransferase family protein [bacterium]|nr:acylneuraminate cytidylyltransferase family protein [bacterium]
MEGVLAVIPARSGSKGLPKKNILLLGGKPLIAHSIEFAKLCPSITKTIVSTDSEEIAGIARQYNCEVPFLRPSELAQDETPMLPVLQHALIEIEKMDKLQYDFLLLLQPTSPFRIPNEFEQCYTMLLQQPEADGIVSVTIPKHNPIGYCVEQKDGYLVELSELSKTYLRRQDLPTIYMLNGMYFLWRRDFLLSEKKSWRNGKNLIYVVPSLRSVDIDTLEDFEYAEFLLQNRKIVLPWISGK